VRGWAEALPFRDRAFDMLSMGFALRHVADLEAAFGECLRVLKPGGRLVLLDLSRPESPAVRWLIRVHLQHVLPRIMRLRSGSEPARRLVRHFWDTIDRCVPPEATARLLRARGFVDVERRVLYGVFSEYAAARPAERGSLLPLTG
jgi:demethylmenaquinone methyltransferase/2-methoxy-6-polyprenyl-1,4-benzoquinol methylase